MRETGLSIALVAGNHQSDYLFLVVSGTARVVVTLSGRHYPKGMNAGRKPRLLAGEEWRLIYAVGRMVVSACSREPVVIRSRCEHGQACSREARRDL